VASAIGQEGGPDYGIVIVNDGCPTPETREVVDGWAALHPGRVRAVHQANQGLSGARNTGIRVALETWPDLEALFFLDADNRLDPTAMQIFGHALDTDAQADWFFPHFDFFGIETFAHNGAPYSVARMSMSNQCEAGSLVRRRVIDAGIRFAEDMRAGYEDWDFWLQASEKGFRGRRFQQTFFRYRKRPESMLSGSHAGDAALREAVMARHRWLYARGGVVDAALAEVPYILAFEAETGALSMLRGAELRPEPVPADDVAAMIFAAHAQRDRVLVPPFVLLLRDTARGMIADPKLGRSVICHLQDALSTTELAVLRVRQEMEDNNYWFHTTRRWATDWMPQEPDRDPPRMMAAFASEIRGGDAVMMKTHRLIAAVSHWRSDEMQVGLARGASIATVHANLPDPVPEVEPEGLMSGFGNLADVMSNSRFSTPGRAAFKTWRWPPHITGPTDMPAVLSRGALHGAPLLLPGSKDRPQIGFVLPILKFGGVEKCAIALARAVRDLGADCHLYVYVYGNENAASTPWLLDPFASVHFVGNRALRDWNGPRYLGTKMASRPPDEIMNRILGPLSGLDAVINSGCAAIHHGLGALRRKGIRTVAWEHLIETGAYGRSYGTPYLALAHEGGYDRIATCSKALSVWMHGQGVPEAKLLAMPNGPGYPLSPDAIGTALAARQGAADAPVLRVGFLGRMDRQKGLDRFLEIAAASADLPLSFSITGKSVLDQEDDAFVVPPDLPLYPPAYDLDELAEAFARIDILLMPSRDEGLPLTIMEAQRLGIVTVVSRVGAVEEAIVDGQTGFLVDPNAVVAETVAVLRRLTEDRNLLAATSTAAANREDQWRLNAEALMSALALER
ncbi:MAG: glycosyltransferase, partial [Pseudomonadota bacterium]